MLVKLQHNHLHIYEEWQYFKSVGWLRMLETMDGLTERTNFVRIDLGKQGNTMLFIFLSY